ncbi:MAG: hypothetical protein HY978_01895 [Candidatus Liptonbacteria bacterium]|nr:hypothetical protein [Candidatus Liptonbacteria bacterium]
MRQYSERTLAFLKTAENGEPGFLDFLAAFLSAGYGASAKYIERQAYRLAARRAGDTVDAYNRRLCSLTLQHLKEDGLIRRTGGTRKSAIYRLTQAGRKLLAKLRQEPQKPAAPIPHYQSGGSKNFVVVAFDVPEKQRWKRDWLRSALAGLELSMIQQSVWVGKAAIPEQFLRDLADLDLLEAVEIFEITRSGTLKLLA